MKRLVAGVSAGLLADAATALDHTLHIVIRQGKDGIEFEEVHRPQSSGSCWVMVAGLAWTALAILFGVRWPRRRQKPV